MYAVDQGSTGVFVERESGVVVALIARKDGSLACLSASAPRVSVPPSSAAVWLDPAERCLASVMGPTNDYFGILHPRCRSAMTAYVACASAGGTSFKWMEGAEVLGRALVGDGVTIYPLPPDKIVHSPGTPYASCPSSLEIIT